MSQPYVGEIRIFAGNFPPLGWEFCEGQEVPISEYDTLFALIGTTYGGDGRDTFKLPNLSGRLPVHQGTGGYSMGATGGVEQVTLTPNQMPGHTHPLMASQAVGNQSGPAGNYLAASSLITPYAAETPSQGLAPVSVSALGGSQPHDNFQPYLCVSHIISMFGIFPSPT